MKAVSILAVPVLAHGLYDAIVMNIGISDWLVLPLLALLIFFCVKMHQMCKKKIVAQLELDKTGNLVA